MEAIAVNGQDGITSWRTITASPGKGTGVDKKCFPKEVIYCDMGMAVNYAIRCGKEIPHSLFNIVPCPGPVTESDAIAINLDCLLCGQCLAGRDLAHVSMYSMNLFVVEDIKDGDICQVTGMEDNGTVLKGLPGLINKPW